ncbi:DUF2637 domain-containing protein [Nocardia sp. NPDC050406]|uniref:DUF2637 domain-containing protein n=1 Tax=Nocardia sp. NPDC050406 TaxID=3364318 RepID=UPI0037A40E7E
MTLLIAVGAFRLSFTALRSLALTAGVATDEAWLCPLIIEGSMAQATAALLATTRYHHRAHAEVDPVPADPEVHGIDAESPVVPPTLATNLDKPVRTKHRSDTTVPSTAQWSKLAASICARDTAGRHPDEVALILTRHFDDGWNATQIADHVHRSRSTVSRVLADATRLRSAIPREAHREQPGQVATEPQQNQPET